MTTLRRPNSRITVLITVAVLLFTGLALTPPAAAADTAGTGVVSAADAQDLKTDCANHQNEAGRTQGWARSRFEQCHHYTEKINLYTTSGDYLGYFDFELWMLAFAYDGSRRVDYVTMVENVHQSSSLVDEFTYLTIRFDCRGTDITCTGPLSRADTIAGWYARSTMDTITVTSPNGVGAGPYKTVDFTETVGFTGEYRDGRTIPFYKDVEAINHVRFDSAEAALGNGKFHGTVFTDHIPRFTLHLSGEGNDEESRHVADTLHHTERTFPTMIGKNAPGQTNDDPLRRLMDPAKRRANHDAAVRVCTDVWGPGYATGGMECDEYPFQSTYEGANESTGGVPGAWHGSARPIPAADNGRGGTLLANFYGANRILDNDRFTVTVEP
jgi:hypothetical protein